MHFKGSFYGIIFMSDLRQVIDNKENIGHLKEAAKRGKLSHAYIINGPEGSGKKTFAAYMAAALLCDEDLEKAPCMQCPSCIKVDTHNHPDVIWVEHEKATVLAVDEIREQIIETVDVAPYYGPYKIYIIKDAHLLNNSGQNALLKTLEEPPTYALFFLLTENADTFLDTIKSRCIKLEMDSLKKETIVKMLEEADVPKNLAEENASLSRGNLGLAKKLAEDEDLAEIKKDAIKLFKTMNNMDALEIYNYCKDMDRDVGLTVLNFMHMWFRDLIFVKEAKDSEQLYFEKEKAVLKRQAEKVSLEGLNRIFAAIIDARQRIKGAVKCEAAMEAAILIAREELKN